MLTEEQIDNIWADLPPYGGDYRVILDFARAIEAAAIAAVDAERSKMRPLQFDDWWQTLTTRDQNRLDKESLVEAWSAALSVAPPGYALVPIEPTKEMINAGLHADADWFNAYECEVERHEAIYKAMIAAAQNEGKP